MKFKITVALNYRLVVVAEIVEAQPVEELQLAEQEHHSMRSNVG